jgi:DNA end-binding protein Ku
MPARSTWKGFLKVSLVNIPIRVFPATESAASLTFNQLHAECQTRIQQKRWCRTASVRCLERGGQGLRVRQGRYVVMQEDDFAKVSTPSTRIINLEQFTDETAVDPMTWMRYYLAPDGQVAGDAQRSCVKACAARASARWPSSGASILSLSSPSSTAW